MRAIVLALLLSGCAVDFARDKVDSMLERKTDAEIKTMDFLDTESRRFARAKCHGGYIALVAYACLSGVNQVAVEAVCNLEVECAEGPNVARPVR